MIIDILFLVAGLVLLFIGGEGLVRGSVSLAKRLGISTLLVSLVIVGFGTSTPELLVSVKAALQGSSDIALGNVVGSNICNILLILGLAASFNSINCDNPAIRRDALAVVGASIFITGLTFTPVLSMSSGIVMILLLTSYLAYCYLQDRKANLADMMEQAELREHITEELSVPAKKSSLLLDLGFTIGGLVLLMWGADFLVKGATSLAREAGISEAVIGLTLVAVGTSLPELATAVVAAYRNHADVVIGNILGSNLFNILGILGITAIITPVPVTEQIANFDIWIMLAVAAVTYGIILYGRQIGRASATIFLCSYFLYICWLYTV